MWLAGTVVAIRGVDMLPLLKYRKSEPTRVWTSSSQYEWLRLVRYRGAGALVCMTLIHNGIGHEHTSDASLI
jgi:hypothetical protein